MLNLKSISMYTFLGANSGFIAWNCLVTFPKAIIWGYNNYKECGSGYQKSCDFSSIDLLDMKKCLDSQEEPQKQYHKCTSNFPSFYTLENINLMGYRISMIVGASAGLVYGVAREILFKR